MLNSASRHAVGGRASARRPAAPRGAGPRYAPATTRTQHPLRPRSARPRAPRSAARARSRSSACSGSSSSGSAASSAIDSARASSSSSASSGSRATRNSGSPCWRVPSTSPSPRSVRSTSARLKPSRSAATASSRLPGELRARVGEQQAEGLVRTAADAPAQLVQLRDAVAVGLLDHHHGRVRHVDADLDHARRDQHVDLARRESRHHRALFARAASARASPRPRSRAAPRRARRSPSTVAARAWSASDSSTSGQTTKHCRPSRRRSRMKS